MQLADNRPAVRLQHLSGTRHQEDDVNDGEEHEENDRGDAAGQVTLVVKVGNTQSQGIDGNGSDRHRHDQAG